MADFISLNLSNKSWPIISTLVCEMFNVNILFLLIVKIIECKSYSLFETIFLTAYSIGLSTVKEFRMSPYTEPTDV